MSWNRVELKAKAKEVLKKYYLLLFVASLILCIVGGNSGIDLFSNRNSASTARNAVASYENSSRNISIGLDDTFQRVTDYGYNWVNRSFIGNLTLSFVKVGIALILILVAICAICFTFLVAFPVKVGGAKIFIESAYGNKPEMNHFGFAFSKKRYKNTVKAGFFVNLYTFLWGLLFVIPGIVKGYSYRMTPYILAENPEMDAASAIRLSQAMTNGHKMNMFIMDLSFIGWYILGGIAFGIGTLFVNPYVDATNAQLYLSLRDIAINTGIAVPENFNMSSNPDEVLNKSDHINNN